MVVHGYTVETFGPSERSAYKKALQKTLASSVPGLSMSQIVLDVEPAETKERRRLTGKSGGLRISFTIINITADQASAAHSNIDAIVADSSKFTGVLREAITEAGAIIPADFGVEPLPITSAPTVAPTSAPTPHPCDDGSHGCDKSAGGVCFKIHGNQASGVQDMLWVCGCNRGYYCSWGCDAQHHEHE